MHAKDKCKRWRVYTNRKYKQKGHGEKVQSSIEQKVFNYLPLINK